MSIRRFFRRSYWDRARLSEIESYVQIETDENMGRGMSYEEARAAAQRKFGNTTQIREEIYEMNTLVLLDTIARDIRYTLRALRHNPTFTAVALLTLGIGIGANTAVFSVVNSVILNPLPYPNSDQLVALRQVAPGAAGLTSFSDGLLLSPSMSITYAEHNRTFQSMGVWATGSANVTGVGQPEQVRIAVVGDGVLQTLDVSPLRGRWFSPADQMPNGTKTVMLSYGYWQRRFGGDPTIIGRTIRVDGKPRQTVGVMPRSFRLVDTDFDLILPAAFERRGLPLAGFGYKSVARLKPNVTIGQANADMARMLSIWMDSWSNGPGIDPHWYENWKITPALLPLKRQVTGSVANALWVVMGTIALVMLIACANVTNLLLVRAESRIPELAVRAALGAGWTRILRELLIESTVLGLLGGVSAAVLAYGSLHLLVWLGPANLPRLNEVSLGARGILFALLLSVAAGLFCGSISALKYAGPRLSAGLRTAGRSLSQSRERHRARNLLVVGQMAMALLLLVSAGLMIRTFQALSNVAPGFADARHLQTTRTSIPATLVPDAERVTRMQQEIATKLAALPGVASAAFIDEMPMEDFGSSWDEVFAEGKKFPGEAAPLRLFKYVSPGFFHTAGTRLLAGRELSWQDIYTQRPVVLISENLAREFWGTPAAAVGKHLRELDTMPWHEVVGVVENTHENGVDKDAPAIVYWRPLMKYLYAEKQLQAIRTLTFILRSDRAGTESLTREVQQAVWSVEPDLPVASVRTMQDVYDRSLSRTSFTLTMLGIAAGMAVVIALVGIYGVISYAVSQRRREIGIRLALGAQQRELKKTFVRSGLALALAGLGIGLIASLAVTRLMTSLLFGISPFDPLTYLATAVILAFAATLASYIPARRAAMVDPVESLKSE
jgi:predicted permease